MDDQFLYDFREEPSPEFADKLRRKLRNQAPEMHRRPPLWRRPAAVAASAVAVFLVALSFPVVRPLAQQFLDLFRIQRFVAVPADPERIKQIARIANEGFDVKSLLSRNVKVVKKPTELQPVESVAAAEQMTGVVVQLPATLPRDVVQEEMFVVREGGALELIADTALLQDILDALALRDVVVPQRLNGAVVKVHLPPRVITKYQRNGTGQALFVQAASPEISLPPGVHLPEIVEIALRILGMSLDEARQYAYSIDWHGTLLVPVPSDVASFREVEVGNSKGLLIESAGHRKPDGSGRLRTEQGSMLLWSDNGKVFSLGGTINKTDLLQMANAIE
jgi:hypothetical protein